MKINGKKPDANVEVCVLPRGDQDSIVFKARAVLDYAVFEKMCPEPEPSVNIYPGGRRVSNFEDPKYLEALRLYNRKSNAWMLIQSLKATDGLEWELVKLEDPETWDLWDKDLAQSGFTPREITRIFETVFAANGLSEKRISDARASFLLKEFQAAELSVSLNFAPISTASSVPASAPVSAFPV